MMTMFVSTTLVKLHMREHQPRISNYAL